MIDIFGTSGMPKRIRDAVIISSTMDPLPVETMYIFGSKSLKRIYKFEERTASELIDTYQDITGYFSVRDRPLFQGFRGESFSIISKIDPHVLLRLESVTTNRARSTVTRNSMLTAFKFKAQRLRDITSEAITEGDIEKLLQSV